MSVSNPSLVVCLVGLHFFTGMMLFSFKAFGSVIEEIYGLSGTMTGLMVSFPEIGYLLSIVPVALVASKFPRPRLIGFGCALIAAGAVVFCVPRFLCKGDRNQVLSSAESSRLFLCGSNPAAAVATTDGMNPASQRRNDTECGASKAWFLSGALLVGVGAGPVTTLHFSYVDDHVDRSKSPVYLGIVQASSLFGMLSSYLLAGVLSRSASGNGLPSIASDDADHHEVRWWLAFLLSAVGCVTASLRFWCLDDERNSVRESDDSSCIDTDVIMSSDSCEYGSSEAGQNVISRYTGPVVSLKRITSDIWLLGTLLAIIGWHFPPIFNGTFILEYMHLQFDISLSSSSYLVGLITGIPALIGIPVGGLIASRPSVQVKELFNYVFVLTLIACFTLPIGCPNPGRLDDIASKTSSACSYRCECPQPPDWRPVCCSDGTSYRSPCFAGCRSLANGTSQIGDTVYVQCACVTESIAAFEKTCTPGICRERCGMHKIGLFVFTLVMKIFLGCLCYIPFGIILMRSVHPSDKALVVALKELFAKFLGDTSGSVAVGRLFDSACLLRKNGENCSLYDMEVLKNSYFLVNLLPLLVSAAIFGVSMGQLSKRRPRD